MSKRPHNDTPQHPRPRLTYEEAEIIWKARDAHRVREVLWAVVLFGFLLEGLPALVEGDVWRTLALLGFQLAILLGLRWVLRHGLRGLRTWWRGLVLVVVLGMMLTGCEQYARAVARLYGYTGDPFPGPCAAESIHAGRCIQRQQGGKP